MAGCGIALCFSWVLVLQIVAVLPSMATGRWEPLIRSPVDDPESEDLVENRGTKWAILVAGSNGFQNYRHQVNI